jgi:hypothetical protein
VPTSRYAHHACKRKRARALPLPCPCPAPCPVPCPACIKLLCTLPQVKLHSLCVHFTIKSPTISRHAVSPTCGLGCRYCRCRAQCTPHSLTLLTVRQSILLLSHHPVSWPPPSQSVINEPSRPLPLDRGAPWPARRCAAPRGVALSQHRRSTQRDHRNPFYCITSRRPAIRRITVAIAICSQPWLQVVVPYPAFRVALPRGGFLLTVNHGSLVLMRSLADLLDQNSRGAKRARSLGTYEARSPGPAGDEGMSWVNFV